MKCDKNTMLLYAVTDRAWTGRMTLFEQVEAALRGGATCVQLREKKLNDRDFLAEATKMAELCHRWGVPLVINDNVEIALRSGADGVHVGLQDMAAADVRAQVGGRLFVGVSAHTVAEARAAVENGADYLGAGAVFATATKTDVQTMQFETLRDICRAVEVPVVAIGGITAQNLPQLAGSGVDGVAVVSAIFADPDPARAAAELCALSRHMVAAR